MFLPFANFDNSELEFNNLGKNQINLFDIEKFLKKFALKNTWIFSFPNKNFYVKHYFFQKVVDSVQNGVYNYAINQRWGISTFERSKKRS